MTKHETRWVLKQSGLKKMTNVFGPLLTRSAAFVIALPGIACAFDPYGVWMRPSTGTEVSFYDCGGKLCAKIVAVKDERRQPELLINCIKPADELILNA